MSATCSSVSFARPLLAPELMPLRTTYIAQVLWLFVDDWPCTIAD